MPLLVLILREKAVMPILYTKLLRTLKKALKNYYYKFHYFAGKITKRYYYEDYVRVYPDGIVFDMFGRRGQPTTEDVNNFLNHCKFYKFAAQFVKNKRVADVGCGSGYGCEILKKAGAAEVCGSDISEHSIRFAKSRYSDFAKFTVQGITSMKEFPNDFFDIAISSEVLEHIKEYGMQEKAISELKRITQKDGLLIIGTPNSELLGHHGFSFDEINTLFKKSFLHYCIFENALVPFGDAKSLWKKRLSEGNVGVIISEHISLSKTVLPDGVNPEIKRGVKAGRFQFRTYDIDTALLHNTHSWVILAVNNK